MFDEAPTNVIVSTLLKSSVPWGVAIGIVSTIWGGLKEWLYTYVMTEWIESLVKHTETELELLGLDQTKLGPLIIGFMKDLHGTLGNQPTAMKSILKTVGDLIDQKPVAPITEKDFVNDKCVRCSYIYKSGDGRYYNDRAVVFKKSYDDPSSQYMYQGQQRSKQEITLPYVLREEIVLIP